MTPQANKIAAHLTRKGSITAIEAAALYRCRSLSRRICDIKESTDMNIKSEFHTDLTGQRYVRYRLITPEQRLSS